jgi:hypothetical protein
MLKSRKMLRYRDSRCWSALVFELNLKKSETTVETVLENFHPIKF